MPANRENVAARWVLDELILLASLTKHDSSGVRPAAARLRVGQHRDISHLSSDGLVLLSRHERETVMALQLGAL